MISCGCGKLCKGQRGLSIHRAKGNCGSSSSGLFNSMSSNYYTPSYISSSSSHYSSSSLFSSSSDMVACGSCGGKFKGQHGLAIHKAKSCCGSSSSNHSSSLFPSSIMVKCDSCGGEYKGQHGLSIHKAKSRCGSSLKSSSTSSKFDTHSEHCEDCGQAFKGKRGLIIHRAKSKCGRARQYQIQKSVDICTEWLNNLNQQDYFNTHYDPSMYNLEERQRPNAVGLNYDIPSTVVNNINEAPQPVVWSEIGIDFKEKIIYEKEKFYQKSTNQTSKESNDWRLNTKTFAERLSFIFKRNLYVDIKFVLNCENKHISLDGHKLIFALSSPIFRAMFYGSLAMDGKVVIKDSSPKAFQNILKYIYTNKIFLKDVDDAIDTHYSSKKYFLYKLENKCVKFMDREINIKNVLQVFEYSILMELKKIEEKCQEIIKRNPEACLRSEYFLNMNLESIMKISEWFFKINVSNKFLGEKIVEWATKECNEQEISKTEENLNSLLEPVLDKIGSETFSILVEDMTHKFKRF
ncbi:uncharacterized protein LOC111642299 [Centruroides sculpturatus]|uniref:uncharacterized protein LOC111642299 n=1 Tax=Centruroides sculpturatus TaxID=218467 RepID=UPI000C6DBCC0|nr:uncharacterized protein LOC111642299 [Centruroides sculpturatus]